ncbi:hypothetical protein [Actinomadura fibrosa]|uniref:DUF4185 domain-containing protein n=1 Tax=Actinomadura fibrosa TaxID=111802 RepID=A0ABW2XQI5_9ACTN|nr:hypothetical protein [Actinomadura fibrosa]
MPLPPPSPRRSDLSRRSPLAAVVCAAALLAALVAAPGHAGAAAAPGTPNTALNQMWARYGDGTGYDTMCGRWSGGDGTQSVLLPSGKRAWFFSDTYLGQVGDRRGFYRSFIHNSIVVQSGTDPATATLRTVTGGNTCQEKNTNLPFDQRYANAPVSGPGGFYWSGTGKVLGSNVVWFYLKSSGSAFLNTGMVTIPVSSLESGTVLNVTPTDLPAFSYHGSTNPIFWGSELLEGGDGYTYVYGWGTVDDANAKKPFLARVPTAQLADFNAWRFYTGGSSWTSTGGATGQAQAQPLQIYTDPMYSVVQQNGYYWHIGLDPVAAGRPLLARPSTTPWGFGSSQVELYRPPEGTHTSPYFYNIYDAHVQRGMGGTSNLVVSYNVNTTAVSQGCRSRADYEGPMYRARFVTVPRSALNPSAATSVQAVKASPAPERGVREGVRTPSAASAAKAASTGAARAAAAPDPSTIQWYDAYAFASGCPPVPGVTGLATVPKTDGSVDLTWNDSGPDITYVTYERNVTDGEPLSPLGLWSDEPHRSVQPLFLNMEDNGDTYEWQIEPYNAFGTTGPRSTPVRTTVRAN